MVLAGGGISQVGAPLELYERPQNEFVAQFIGSPAMNLFPGVISGTGPKTTVQLADGGVAVSDVPTRGEDGGMKVNVGIRPEDLLATTGDAAFSGVVDFTEALGEVTILYFQRQGREHPVIAKLAGIHAELRGREVRLAADPGKVHIFAEGRSLLYR